MLRPSVSQLPMHSPTPLSGGSRTNIIPNDTGQQHGSQCLLLEEKSEGLTVGTVDRGLNVTPLNSPTIKVIVRILSCRPQSRLPCFTQRETYA